MQEGCVALLPELLVLLALHASHPLHHLLAQLHGRRQRFGVAAEDVAKVHVEELPWTVGWRGVRQFLNSNLHRRPFVFSWKIKLNIFQNLLIPFYCCYPQVWRKKNNVCLTRLCQEQIIQVSVSDAQDVRDDTVTSWEDAGRETTTN